MAFDPAATNGELEASLVKFNLILEGHRDDARVNVEATTLDDVQVQIERYARLIAMIEAVIAANNELIDAGWPDLTPREVDAEVLVDLDAQLASMTAARETYVSNAARSMTLKSGEPVEKL